MHGPDAGLGFRRQAHALQALQAAHQQQALALQLGVVEAFNLDQAGHGFALQGAVEACPSLLLHLAGQRALDLQLGARPQPFGRQFHGPLAHAAGDVLLRDDEILAGVVLAAQHDVRVRVVGVPVIDRHPIETGAQVSLHSLHQVAGVGAQVFKMPRILGRDDEAELVAVFAPSLLEGAGICLIGQRPIGMARPALAIDALALDVAQVLDGGPAAGLLEVHQPHLDRGPARERRQRLTRKAGRRVATPQT